MLPYRPLCHRQFLNVDPFSGPNSANVKTKLMPIRGGVRVAAIFESSVKKSQPWRVKFLEFLNTFVQYHQS